MHLPSLRACFLPRHHYQQWVFSGFAGKEALPLNAFYWLTMDFNGFKRTLVNDGFDNSNAKQVR